MQLIIDINIETVLKEIQYASEQMTRDDLPPDNLASFNFGVAFVIAQIKKQYQGLYYTLISRR